MVEVRAQKHCDNTIAVNAQGAFDELARQGVRRIGDNRADARLGAVLKDFAFGCADDDKLGDVLHKVDEASLAKLGAIRWPRSGRPSFRGLFRHVLIEKATDLAECRLGLRRIWIAQVVRVRLTLEHL